MALSDRPSPVTDAVRTKLISRATQLGVSPRPGNVPGGGFDIYWPDQQKIPGTPCICLDSGEYVRTLTGIGGKGRTDNTFQVILIVYLCKIQDIQLTEISIEQFSENVMDVLHEDVTLGGVVTHGFVGRIEPGYANRSNTLYRTARITWEGMTKTLIA